MVGVVAAVGLSREVVAAWVPLLILCTSVPHYGATLLRVYATADARRRYSKYGLAFGLLVWGAFALSLATPDVGRWFITLYLTWSPWHYTAQNFGLSLMFLQRGGVSVDAPLRRLIKLSYVLSFVVILAGIHGATFTAAIRCTRGRAATSSRRSRSRRADPSLLARDAACRRDRVRCCRLRGAATLRARTVSAGREQQLVWFIVPVLVGRSFRRVRAEGGSRRSPSWGRDHARRAVPVDLGLLRACVGARGSRRRATLGYLGAAILVGAAIWVVPAWLLAPGVLGVLAFDSGLGLLVASAVNLHHFLLDGVIWKLRDARVGAALVARPAPAPAPALGLRTNVSWPLRVGIAAVGALAVAFWSIGTWEREVGYRQALLHDDVERLELASRRLALVGRDGPKIHEDLGRKRAQRGEQAKALEEYRRSQALAPTPDAWPGMAVLYTRAWNALRERFN
jgi:hypothetical protein